MHTVNDVKKDPATGIVAVKTGHTDPLKSWLVVMTADGSTHFVEDADVTGWEAMSVPPPVEVTE